MNVRLLMLPLFLASALLIGCEKKDAATDSKAADTKANIDKAAADTKAAAEKAAADAKATAKKAAADADSAAEKTTANAKAAAEKAAADKKTADNARDEASKLLADLQTAVTNQKWSDAGAIVKQLDGLRDRLAVDQKATFDTLKKQYETNKP